MSGIQDVTVCLFTSTKGHFGRTDIYQETALSLLEEVPVANFANVLASIKADESSTELAGQMAAWLIERGVDAHIHWGSWKHGDQSHQSEYLQDMERMNRRVKSPYFLHLEDDWHILARNKTVADWLSRAVAILDDNQDLMQVRIPRYTNEQDRIRGLMAKHGIDGKAELALDGDYYRSNDWSNNPFVARTRDMRAALTFVASSNLPKHSEHGISPVMKLLSGHALPFAFLRPADIRCAHMGTPEGQEDDLSKELFV